MMIISHTYHNYITIFISVPNFMIYVTTMYICPLFLLSPSLYLFITSNLSSWLLYQWGGSRRRFSIFKCSTITAILNNCLFLLLLLLSCLLCCLWPFTIFLSIQILFAILSANFNSYILRMLSKVVYLFAWWVVLWTLYISFFLFKL